MKRRILKSENFFKDFKHFFKKNKATYKYFKSNDFNFIPYSEWTAGIEKIMQDISKKNNIYVKGHHTKNRYAHTEELLCVDFNFFRKEPDLYGELTKNNLPIISVEHENAPDRIKYNFNKLVNLQTQLKVLICYVNENFDNRELIRELAEFISESLLDESKYLIIIGNTKMSEYEEFDGFVIYPSGFWKEIQ